MTDMYAGQYAAPGGRAPELDSHPVAIGRTKSGRTSELEGSYHSPAVSTSTNGAGPPQYSPASPGLKSVQEEPQELWGGYVVWSTCVNEPKR